MDLFYIILILSLLLIINTSILSNTTEEYIGYYLAQPTKCFSCENQLPDNKKYMGGPTKCFSCEKELAMRYGGDVADLAQPTKCFSCERQMGKRPF